MPTDPRCPNFIHDAIVATAVDFAKGTTFISASGDENTVIGKCRRCSSRLTYSLEDWRDAPTLIMTRRSVSRTTTKETER